MSRPLLIFVSYDQADESHLRRLDVALAPLRHEGLIELWHELMIAPGGEKAQQTEQQLAKADVVLLLISPDFVASDRCWQDEMKLALQRHQAGDAVVIPILVRPTEFAHLPFARLQALPLNLRPVTSWSDPDAAWLTVAQGLRQTVAAKAAALAKKGQTQPAAERVEPALGATARPLPPPKGAYDPAWYLEREDEQDRARAAWMVPGAPVVLQAPELFGKTWVLMQLLNQLHARGRTVYVHLKTVGEEALASFSAFLREIGRLILERCAVADAEALLEKIWRRPANPEANLSWLLSTEVLPPIAASSRWLILAFDGVDALAERSYFDRFLALLRGMAETAPIAPWGALRMVLTVSSTIALRGLDIHRSPLENVAQIIPLAELSPAQVAQMATWYGRSNDAKALADLTDFVGGHPYLAHLALHEAHQRKQPLSEMLLPQARVFDSYVQMCRKRLLQHPKLHETLRAILLDGRAPVNEDSASKLIDAGFLTDDYDLDGNRALRLRYRLYRRLG